MRVGKGWGEERGTLAFSPVQPAFEGRAPASSRPSLGIFHRLQEVVLQAGILPQPRAALCRLQKA